MCWYMWRSLTCPSTSRTLFSGLRVSTHGKQVAPYSVRFLLTSQEGGRRANSTPGPARGEKLKVTLTSAPVLGFPQESGGIFICDADASSDDLGSDLSQVQNGQERVIGYYSKCFNKAVWRYCTTRKELVAVLSSVKHWHHYLYGRHFKVRSDHGSLRWLINFKICEGALARILETLAIYDFEIEFRQGSRHKC